MEKIKIGIPKNSIYFDLYKIYFDKLDFDIVESIKSISNKYIDNLYDNIDDLKTKCDYIILPKYKVQKINKKYNCNFIIHEVDSDNDRFIHNISNKFYIDKNLCKLAYEEAVIKYIMK